MWPARRRNRPVHWDEQVQQHLATPGTLEHLQALVRLYRPAHPVLVGLRRRAALAEDSAWWRRRRDPRAGGGAQPVERAPGPRVKTDRLDARMLALKAAAGQLKGVAIPTRIQHEHRQVLRTYGQAVRARKRAQIQLRSVLQEHGRIGPLPGSGWRVYEPWLTGQVLPAPVAAAVAELRTLRAAAPASAGPAGAAAARPGAPADLCAPGGGAHHARRRRRALGHAGAAQGGDITPRLWRRGLLTHYLGLTPSEYRSATRRRTAVRFASAGRRDCAARWCSVPGPACAAIRRCARSSTASALGPAASAPSLPSRAAWPCASEPLARGARHPTRGRGITGGRSTPPCPCWSGNVPHECLRRRPGSPPTGGTSQSFAALGP